MLSGLRPNTTGVTLNTDSLYDNIPGVVTLPRWFRQHGYATARAGKIFHLGIPNGNQSHDDPQAWDFGMPFKDERPYPAGRESAVKVKTGNKRIQLSVTWRESRRRRTWKAAASVPSWRTPPRQPRTRRLPKPDADPITKSGAEAYAPPAGDVRNGTRVDWASSSMTTTPIRASLPTWPPSRDMQKR